jgi:predicted ChrR family anti-sigma factor
MIGVEMSRDPHLGLRLFDLANQALPADERVACEVHVAVCPKCASELAWIREQLAAAALSLPPVAPRPDLKERLAASLDHGGRFRRHLDRLAALFEIDRAAAGAVLDRLDDPAAWRPSRLPGLRVQAVPTGPRLAGADAQMLRFAPGTRFPAHVHHGAEQLLFLQGRARDDAGLLLQAGDLHRSESGSRHAFTVDEGAECLCAALVEGTLEFVGP